MMPGVVSERGAADRAAVSELTIAERTVALYASAMPPAYRFRRGDDAPLLAWIAQGADLLGSRSLRLLAGRLRGYELLAL
ncbi:hypothetical protein G3I76_74790, partial [Streptomyces sp. SID11233]|nr:hypothetical protein [Streptomyces sp. SID11233]